MRQKLLIALLACLLSAVAEAEVRLPKLIGDGMVLQRNAKVKIWGWAEPGEKISLQFSGREYTTTADNGGDWRIALSALDAGGPHSMEIRGENRISLHDILVGDVWLLSGQSNMEYPISRIAHHYADEIAAIDNPQIRQFQVPQTYDFNNPRKDLASGEWKAATRENIADFSAVGYFFAARTFSQERVPIGLINASLGGSPAEAWLSEESLKKFPAHYAELQKFKDPALIEKIERSDRARIDNWYQAVDAQDAGMRAGKPLWNAAQLDTQSWPAVPIPGYWSDAEGESEGEQTQGVFWFRKTFTLAEQFAGKKALLELGRIVDADTTFINGEQVGQTTYLYPRRRYAVPAGLLEAGHNTIAIRVVNERGRGGFVPDKPYRLTIGDTQIDLRGNWQYRVGATAEPLAGQTFVRWKPTGLFNAMIHPLLNYRIKGALWYQGESNVGRAEEYAELFPALIRDWRARWRQGDFPFLYVQLANFLEPVSQPANSDWAKLREAQRGALTLPNTAMAVAIDLGEWNDIHPLNKKDIGERLALAARGIAYGDRDTVISGPSLESSRIAGNKIILDFANTGGGLIAKGASELQQFAIAGKDRQFAWAQATIEKNRVLVWSEQVPEPVAVRYAWADNPESANLYNREGLPASPFRTDNW